MARRGGDRGDRFGLFDPTRGTLATLRAIESGLRRQAVAEFIRDAGGGTYDVTEEWVFIDLRMERAMELHGETANQTSLFAWNTDQALDNYGELSETHDPTTADYA